MPMPGLGPKSIYKPTTARAEATHAPKPHAALSKWRLTSSSVMNPPMLAKVKWGWDCPLLLFGETLAARSPKTGLRISTTL